LPAEDPLALPVDDPLEGALPLPPPDEMLPDERPEAAPDIPAGVPLATPPEPAVAPVPPAPPLPAIAPLLGGFVPEPLAPDEAPGPGPPDVVSLPQPWAHMATDARTITSEATP
jgi:hypothetical protein